MTVLVVERDGTIVEAARIVSRFVGQPIANLEHWMSGQGGFRKFKLRLREPVMPKAIVSRWEVHRQRWSSCTRCPLCERRTHVVLARGKVPAEILFVGEAAGMSEDVIGIPFVGPAGHLLDYIIEQALDGQYDYCMTNLVACIPLDESGSKAGEPPAESIRACAPRLNELVIMCKPELVVFVGKLPEKWFDSCVPNQQELRRVSLVHPAAILRAEEAQKGLAIQRNIVTLADAAAEIGAEK